MKVGILDILTTPSRSWAETAYNGVLTKQYASITPQAIAVWCRQLGHKTFYAAYNGTGDPKRLIPDDVDVVFIAAYTQASALAYALAKLYRAAGTRTVIGGPHAKAYPRDCLRFFDLAVAECDKTLIADILKGVFAPGTIVTSSKPFDDVPTVEERMPEIRASAFWRGRRPFCASTIPLLASVGCPYACNFCIDWNNPYRLLSTDRLQADLRYASAHLPGVMLGYHDPNFAVRFDQVLGVMESIPRGSRNPYIMEASLTILRGGRMARLRDTNCVAVLPGVESWNDYSNKAGVGGATGAAKVEMLVEHFALLHEYVPYLQANFMFGLDIDGGDQPIELTKEFMWRTPFVWPVVNIPHPFGGTPLFDRYLEEDRILTSMPFTFYYSPYLVTVLKNYTAAIFYRKLIDLFSHFTSGAMLRRRLATTNRGGIRAFHVVRTLVKRRRMREFRKLLDMLDTDGQFRAFHERRSDTLPEFYQHAYDRMLGPYASLMSRAERTPLLERAPIAATAAPKGSRASTRPRDRARPVAARSDGLRSIACNAAAQES
jgi:hypothetical protein